MNGLFDFLDKALDKAVQVGNRVLDYELAEFEWRLTKEAHAYEAESQPVQYVPAPAAASSPGPGGVGLETWLIAGGLVVAAIIATR